MPHGYPLAPPPPVDTVRSVQRINRAMFFVGAIFSFVGLRFFLFPDQLAQTAVGRALPGLWDETWSGLYMLGGLLVMIGISARRPRVELPGVTLLAAATAVNGGAIIIAAGERGITQLPLYVLVLWVFEGRIRDLHDLPRERRHGAPDQRDGNRRVERRLHLNIAPLVLVLAAGDAGSSLLIALLGGGVVTAIAQALLVKPQRRGLEASLSKTAVEAADIALRQARAEARELRDEIHTLKGALQATERRCDNLERVLIEHGLPLP